MQASPSKARAQAIASHSWSIVHTWLARLYHPTPVPAFERNAATLKALQSLMAENIAADRVRELLFEAKVEELAAGEEAARLERRATLTDLENSCGANAILSLLETSLASSSRTALQSLASSVVLLGCVSSTTSTDASVLRTLTSQIVNIPRQTFAQESQLSAIETLTATLQSQITETQKALAAFAERTTPRPAHLRDDDDDDDPPSPSFPPPTTLSPATPPPTTSLLPSAITTTTTTTTTMDYSHLHGVTLQHQRETKQLALKSAEYKSQIDALSRALQQRPSSNLWDGEDDEPDPTAVLAAKQRSLGAKKKQIEALEGRLRQFHGLPPDVDGSRAEVRRAQGELDRLRGRRDELFEAL
ncbi:uncharacterized protein PV07_07641 [Cladophialophora immunda]|uniref:Uncharacterized protein n=1 Tax=Cladophialophora immunda TaxID=569365 RepID=A0A0D1ZJ07_9EURO|nr:uncharacterized protein PV07_07641 [Cladophialophora immunda]KIW27946.1 hypothetical protein PV07_07641 [Cladophialophora immunda]